MPREHYVEWNPRGPARDLVEKANEIVSDYQRQGLTLTLRQLYYRFVAGGFLPNDQKNYTKLGDVIGRARLAGLLDWDAIEDRGRNLQGRSHWGSPSGIIDSAAYGYKVDLWADQEHYVEVWVEKQALEAIIGNVAYEWDCPYIACKGYMSLSEVWAAAKRFKRMNLAGRVCHIVHLGDHDPSGIDMTRDILSRITSDFRVHIMMHRVALNMDQIEEYNPPPNPAKLDDPRAKSYVAEHGDESWELDALEPRAMHTIIEDAIKEWLDIDLFEERKRVEASQRDELKMVARRYQELVTYCKARPSRED